MVIRINRIIEIKDDGTIISDNLDFHGLVKNPELTSNRNTKQLVRKINTYIEFLKENKDMEAKMHETEKEHKETVKREVKRPRFKFSMCGIKIGELITFNPTGIVVKVASDDSIEYEDRIYKLSPFVGTFMPEEQRNTSGAYQGAKYFSYNGKVLDEIRKEKEENEIE